jgi:hypothetical protein
MSQRNLYCDQANCGQEASVFAIQFSAKIKVCRMHGMNLTEKYASVFSIAAYDFIETMEDYPEYVARRNAAEKLKGTVTVLQERCESNRNEATSRLQTTKETTLALVERSYQELQMQVDQRCEKVKEELRALIVSLEEYTSDKHYVLPPVLAALNDFQPAGALFRVVQANCSLLLEKTLRDYHILLPSDEVIPQKETGQKLRIMAESLQAEIAEEVCLYATELIGQQITPEEMKQDSAEAYLQEGKTARENGDYSKSLKDLERGWDLMQQSGIENAEMCLHMGMVLAHF